MSEATPGPSWQTRITGRWALSWQAFTLGVLVNVPLMILTGGRIGTRIVPVSDMPVLTAYGLGAAALVGAWALLMDATLMRHRRVRRVALWEFGLLHAMSGAIFGVAIVLADARLGISLDLPPAVTIAITIALGLWWGTTSSMVLEAHARFVAERSHLIDEAVLSQLASIEDSVVAMSLADDAITTRSAVTAQLSVAREDLMGRVESSGSLSEWLDAAQLLRNTVDETVRPLSHALWQEASLRYPEPRLSGVLALLARDPTFLPLPAASVIVIGYLGATSLAYGPLLGILLVLALGGLAFLILSAGNAAIRAWRPGRHAVYFVAVCSLQAATLVLAYGPARVEGTPVPTALVAGSIMGTLIAVLLTSAIASLDASRAAVMSQLQTQLNSEQLLQTARSRSRSLALRELAKELHGTVQTRLIACSSAIELSAAQGDSAGCLRALAEAVRILDQVRAREEATVAEQLEAIATSWNPICTVTLAIDPEVGHLMHQDTIRVVEEAIGNAYRHGAAGKVDVTVTRVDDGIEVRVLDDGLGPGGGLPGLGSDLLARATRGQFGLNPAPGGGAELVARLPAEA